MAHHKIEYDCECSACGGTGLYVGMAERDGAAVVCRRCKGTGCVHRVIEYDDFDGRKAMDGVRRVYLANPGIVIGEKDGVCALEDFGGMPHHSWVSGDKFIPGSEDRAHTCPCWFYQSADATKKPEWDECYKALGRTFSHCPYFGNKSACWSRWDAEFAS